MTPNSTPDFTDDVLASLAPAHGFGALTSRCDWLFDSEGARCTKAAVWESPCLMEDGSLKVWKLCEQHKTEAAEATRKMREEHGMKDTWRRVRQNEGRLCDSHPDGDSSAKSYDT